MRRPSVLQVNTVVLAVALTACYVYYRSAQAQDHRDQVMPASKMRPLTLQRLAATTQSSPASEQVTLPTIAPRAVFYGTKSAAIDFSRAQPQRAGQAEEPVLFGDPTVTTAPSTQPAQ